MGLRLTRPSSTRKQIWVGPSVRSIAAYFQPSAGAKPRFERPPAGPGNLLKNKDFSCACFIGTSAAKHFAAVTKPFSQAHADILKP